MPLPPCSRRNVGGRRLRLCARNALQGADIAPSFHGRPYLSHGIAALACKSTGVLPHMTTSMPKSMFFLTRSMHLCIFPWSPNTAPFLCNLKMTVTYIHTYMRTNLHTHVPAFMHIFVHMYRLRWYGDSRLSKWKMASHSGSLPTLPLSPLLFLPSLLSRRTQMRRPLALQLFLLVDVCVEKSRSRAQH